MTAHAALFAFGAALVAVVGVLGLQGDSSTRSLLEAWIDIHALFGLLLCGLVIARYLWIVQCSRHRQELIGELSRHLSRIVYSMLFLIAGVSQSLCLIHWNWHGAAPGYAPYGDFHMTLLSGGIALAVVRVVLAPPHDRDTG